MSEPAILVKRAGVGSQVWSMEKLENKLIDMRDMYSDWKMGPNSYDSGSQVSYIYSFFSLIMWNFFSMFYQIYMVVETIRLINYLTNFCSIKLLQLWIFNLYLKLWLNNFTLMTIKSSSSVNHSLIYLYIFCYFFYTSFSFKLALNL